MRFEANNLNDEPQTLTERYQALSRSKKFILIVFMIWLAQALPKWTAAVTADGEMSASIMKLFVTPRADRMMEVRTLENFNYTSADKISG